MGIGTVIFGGVLTYLITKAFTGESAEIEGLSEFTERQALIRERKREMRKISKEINFAQRLQDMDDEIAEGRQALERYKSNQTLSTSHSNDDGGETEVQRPMSRPRPARPPRPSREEGMAPRGRDLDM